MSVVREKGCHTSTTPMRDNLFMKSFHTIKVAALIFGFHVLFF